MRTIRAKITILFVLVFGFTLSLFSAALYYLDARQTAENFDLGLSNDALEIVSAIKSAGDLENRILSNQIKSPIIVNFGSKRFVQIVSTSRQILIKSSNLNDASLPLTTQVLSLALTQHQVFETLSRKIHNRFWDSGDLRLLTYPVIDNGSTRYLVQVASSTATLDNNLFELRLLLGFAIPLAIIAAAIGGYYVAKKAFDPINRIIKTAQTISAEHLDRRLEIGKVDDEISRLSKTLNAMFDRIEEGFRLQKQFTADASHELRTPLTILLGEIEVALQNKRTPEDYQEILRSAVEEIRRITTIVDELLTIARLESGQLTLQKVLFRLDELLLEAVSKTSAYASRRNISIHFDVEDHNNAQVEEIYINGDRDKLLNVFMNLLDNAIKYSNDRTSISVIEEIDGDFVKVSIIDRGIGISEADLQHVFDRFYRADKSRADHGQKRGSGLGLSIAKSLVEAHGGKIEITSTVGIGTSVSVILPRAFNEDRDSPVS
ncbi:MAG: sensor histidine kinase [Candidatus Kryptoniota bacterium]